MLTKTFILDVINRLTALIYIYIFYKRTLMFVFKTTVYVLNQLDFESGRKTIEDKLNTNTYDSHMTTHTHTHTHSV